MNDPPSTSDLHRAAHVWQAGGASVIPIADDGSKRPAIPWKQYQSAAADPGVIDDWFYNPDSSYGLGVVCGAVSGQLEMYEFEARAVAEGLVVKMAAAMAEHGQADLWTVITAAGYMEQTPSGGLHLYYRVQGESRPNRKLARRPATDAELALNPDEKVKVMIETRGEGGQSVVAPTPGTHHTSGQPWKVLAGSPDTIPTITAEQRDLLHAVSHLFDVLPAESTPPTSTFIQGPAAAVGGRPGDDYNARTEWKDILHGWTRMRRIGAGWGWRRPGKKDPGISATTGTAADGVDRLYVFSTSTDFDTETPYNKFAAYTHLNHGGDFKAAAQALARNGYGTSPPPPPITNKVNGAKPHTSNGSSLFDETQPESDDKQEPPEQRVTDQFLADIKAAAYQLRVSHEARLLVAAERQPAQPFDAGLLAELLLRAPEPPYRIASLIPSDAATLVVAQRKTGKTTLLLNLARSLITGEDFLGRMAVRPIEGRVAYLNYEVGAAQIARWAEAVDVPDDRILFVNLRGRRNPLNNTTDRAELVALLYEHDVESIIVDPFGRAYTGLSQNDSGEVQAWLTDLEHFTRTEVRARDLVLAAHAGWDGERTRGASALEDNADSVITMVWGKQDDDDDKHNRYLRALGRDVDIDEDLLQFDPRTRRLSLSGEGGRVAAPTARRAEDITVTVLGIVTATPGINGTAVEAALKAARGGRLRNGAGRAVLQALVDSGRLVVAPGARNERHYTVNEFFKGTSTPKLPGDSWGNVG